VFVQQNTPTLSDEPGSDTPAPDACGRSGSFTSVFGPLDLSDAQILARGADRYVFQHPHEPSLLIKVINMEAYTAYLERKPLKRFYKQFQRESAYRVYLNELSEYVTTTTVPSGVWNVPMSRVVGLAQTTLGLAQLVEKITGDDGRLAPRWPISLRAKASRPPSAGSSTRFSRT